MKLGKASQCGTGPEDKESRGPAVPRNRFTEIWKVRVLTRDPDLGAGGDLQ